jgi:hypothetical protein
VLSDAELKDAILACFPSDDAKTSASRQKLFLTVRSKTRQHLSEQLAQKAWQSVALEVPPLKSEKLCLELFELFRRHLGQ